MQPNDLSSQEHLERAIAAEKSGNTKIALEYAVLACASPSTPTTILLESGRIASTAGDHVCAAALYQRAFALLPSKAHNFLYLLEVMESGDLARAEAELRHALRKSPKEFKFLNLLGVVLKRAGRLDEALDWFTKASKSSPKDVKPWTNMGNCHMDQHEPVKAAKCYERAIQLYPQDSENHRLLGRALMVMGQKDKALRAFRASLQRNPKNPWIYTDLANVHYVQDRFDSALEIIDNAASLFPGHVGIASQRASILRKIGRIDEARAILEDILKRQPEDMQTLVMLGNLYLYGLQRREEANALYERVLAINPDHIDALHRYCESLVNSRHDDEAAHFQKAYEIACALLEKTRNPLSIAGTLQQVFLRTVDYERYSRLGKNEQLLRYWAEQMAVNHIHLMLGRVETMGDRINLLKAHRQWGDRIQSNAAERPISRETKAPHKRPEKIRIGIMSSDLRNHPVSYFVQPLLETYDRDRFELYCYSFYPKQPDRFQQHVAERVDGFRVILDRSDRDIAQSIADDGIDILFELGAITAMNRAQVCAWRPAPVQVSWLGYPHSVGLSSIDYILVDPYNLPTSEDLLIEKPFLMPETWVSLGSLGFYDIPIEPGLPQDRQGFITFGTANNPYKYTRQSFAVWAEVMKAVEGAKFLFLRPEGGARAFRENVCREFALHGIAAERVLFEPVRGTHMPHYNRIDIALDPFPHVGGTTTCESLWMGVPVVTLAGPAFFERLSASNLHNAGLGDLCADTPEAYMRIAAELAFDRQRRLYLRHGLRDQIRAHPLGQTERFVRHFEAVVTRTLETHRPAR